MPHLHIKDGHTHDIYANDITGIISKDFPEERKCRKQPMRVQRNCAFAIDTQFITLEDLPADGNGSYVNNGRSTHTYRRNASGKWKKVGTKCSSHAKLSVVYFTREYRAHKQSDDFRQTIFYVRTKDGEILNNLAILQYRFTGLEHPIQLSTHGNAKSGKSYTRTKPSVKQILSENLKRLPASEAVAKTRKDLGAQLSTSSESEAPRGRTQAYDMKRERSQASCSQTNRRHTDEMTALNWFAKTDGKGFVRMQELSAEPMILLATEKQLADVSRFCTNHINFSYLSVDPTFNFVEFSVTPTSYRNVLLKNKKTGNSPVFVGPIFIHHTKTKETYAQFFSKLCCLSPQIQDLIVFGTDGEKALSDALSETFPLATHLRCFIHFKRNIESNLHSLKVKDYGQYYAEMFGKQVGTVYERSAGRNERRRI